MKGSKYQPEIGTITLHFLAYQLYGFSFTHQYNPGFLSHPIHTDLNTFLETVLGSAREEGSICTSKKTSKFMHLKRHANTQFETRGVIVNKVKCEQRLRI